MSRKKRGRGAVNAAAPKRNAQIKSNTSTSRASRRAQRKSSRMPTAARSRKRAQPFAPRRECWLYDGQTLLGTLFVKHSGETLAFDSARAVVGAYPTQKAAAAAVDAAARSRVLGPVAYTTGLPEHFLVGPA
jgi:hypothetical protein